MQQVMMNLALNARDAMPDGGELRFGLSAVAVAPDAAPPVAGMDPGEYVCLSVSDTGMGMSEEVQSHLFEPFFTTKEVDEGTGLGLAQVYGIIRQHRGHIDVSSAVDEGTLFRIYLPRANGEKPSPAASPETAPAPRGRGETILVVEDAQEILGAVRAGLTSLDYRVKSAQNGQEALAILANERIDLVLTDVVMPDMGGKALLRELRARRPELPVLAMTGHVLEEDGEALKESGFSDVIAKPFSMPHLATVIAATLDAREG
jgi:CheY-like chemotaxis protein